MTFKKTRGILAQVVSIAILSVGFAQFSWAGTIGTGYLIDADSRTASLARIEAVLAEENLAKQLQQFGVDPAAIESRLQGMTAAELAALEGRIGDNIAGSDALGTIGAVFLILLILELVGVTDIFKSI